MVEGLLAGARMMNIDSSASPGHSTRTQTRTAGYDASKIDFIISSSFKAAETKPCNHEAAASRVETLTQSPRGSDSIHDPTCSPDHRIIPSPELDQRAKLLRCCFSKEQLAELDNLREHVFWLYQALSSAESSKKDTEIRHESLRNKVISLRNQYLPFAARIERVKEEEERKAGAAVPVQEREQGAEEAVLSDLKHALSEFAELKSQLQTARNDHAKERQILVSNTQSAHEF
eukprot:1134944-Rhodomonas_salina.1